MSIKSWHSGEVAAQEARGYGDLTGEHEGAIQNEFPPDHRAFYPILNFLPIATLDPQGRPWMSVLCGSDGRRGFCTTEPVWSSSREAESELRLAVGISPYDPAYRNLQEGPNLGGNHMKVAGIGVELLNRRRNKFAGIVKNVVSPSSDKDTAEWHITFVIQNVLGNCPKYINTRVLVPNPNPRPPQLIASDTTSSPLPQVAIDMIAATDLVFLASVYHSKSGKEYSDPSRLGANIRGGRPGFVRVASNEQGGTVVYVPDFSGNRFMQSIGNIQSVPLAGLTVPSFGIHDPAGSSSTTRLLYITGDAKVLYGSDAAAVMRSAHCVIEITVREFRLVDNAIPLVIDGTARVFDSPGQIAASKDGKIEPSMGWSPYNPPVWPLCSEISSSLPTSEPPSATLESFVQHSSSLATFTWQTPHSLTIIPGQHVILGMNSLRGAHLKAYTHMAWARGGEKHLNDDGVRSYTVSRVFPASTSAEGGGTRFSVTLRLSDRGAVTPNLFRRGVMLNGQLSDGVSRAALKFVPQVPLLGIGGEFVLPSSTTGKEHRLMYLVNGIGITPLLAHLHNLAVTPSRPVPYHIFAVIATRADEMEVVRALLLEALRRNDLGTRLAVHIHFVSPRTAAGDGTTITPASHHQFHPALQFTEHHGVRLSPTSLKPQDLFLTESVDPQSLHLSLPYDASSYDTVYVCGSTRFERAAREALEGVGIVGEVIKTESFSF